MNKIIVLVCLIPLCKEITAQNPCPGTPTVAYAGKTYNTVQIGNQCWLKENLSVGKMIKGQYDQTDNKIVEKYCHIDIESNCDIFGGLYQWAEAVQYKDGASSTTYPNPAFSSFVQGICPDGWHIPTKSEFEILKAFVNNDNRALKAVGQGTGDGAGTNTSGFTALLTGDRYYDGHFWDHTKSTRYWSITHLNTTGLNTTHVYDMMLYWDRSSIDLLANAKTYGFPVRCLKDDSGTDIYNYSEKIPVDYDLAQNYPNPSNMQTTIGYSIPKSGYVTLKVFDSRGSEVATLVSEYKQAGYYKVVFDGTTFSSGVYYYQIRAGQFVGTKKFVLLK